MCRADRAADEFGNLFKIQFAPRAGNNNFSLLIGERGHCRGDFCGVERLIGGTAFLSPEAMSKQFATFSAPLGAPITDRSIPHHSKQPGNGVGGNDPLPCQLNQGVLHAVIGRIAPLGGKQREGSAMLIEQVPQQFGSNAIIHSRNCVQAAENAHSEG